MTPPIVGHRIARADGEWFGARGEVYTYAMAENGLFVRSAGAHLWATIRLAETKVRGLRPLNPSLHLVHGRVPSLLWDLALDVLLAAWPRERYVAVCWDAEQGVYQLQVPDQEGSAARVEYARPENAVLEMHSHPNMPARFSGTDDKDEQGFQIYGVVGGRSPRLQATFRVGVYGHYGPARWGEIFEGPPTLPLETEPHGTRFCRACGCTDDDACVTALGSCSWVEAEVAK